MMNNHPSEVLLGTRPPLAGGWVFFCIASWSDGRETSLWLAQPLKARLIARSPSLGHRGLYVSLVDIVVALCYNVG